MEKEDTKILASNEDVACHRICLPPHVQAYMYGSKLPKISPSELRKPLGMLGIAEIQRDLREAPRPSLMKKERLERRFSAKEDKEELRLKPSSSRRMTITRLSQMLSKTGKPSKDHEISETKQKTKIVVDRNRQFDSMINQNPYKKIAFLQRTDEKMGIPPYVTARLETACQSARYELPVNRKCLEKMTQLEFLTTYTRLYKEQRNRYLTLFKKFKSRVNDVVEFSSLYPALNSMFGGFLSKENFDILCLALFLDESCTLDPNTFTAVCTYCDRLYWSSYLDGTNTFNYWAANRSALEVVDFHNLSWKLDGINLSKELRCLLFSLA